MCSLPPLSCVARTQEMSCLANNTRVHTLSIKGQVLPQFRSQPEKAYCPSDLCRKACPEDCLVPCLAQHPGQGRSLRPQSWGDAT